MRLRVSQVSLGVVGALLVASCSSSGISQADLDEATARVVVLESEASSLRTDLAAAEADSSANAELVATLEVTLATLEDDLAAAEDRVADLESQLEDAEAQAADAIAAADQLRLAYDPQIQEAKAELVDRATDAGCAAGTAAAQVEAARPTLAVVLATLATDFPGLVVADLVDGPAVTAEIDRCYSETALQMELTSNKGDGFYTVGVEIAPGLWQSQGTGSTCYWARLDSNQGILDNHFGSAGGTVRVRTTDYEVNFDDCGAWVYEGS